MKSWKNITLDLPGKNLEEVMDQLIGLDIMSFTIRDKLDTEESLWFQIDDKPIIYHFNGLPGKEGVTKKTYKIVGTDEADIEKNLISISAPLCKAMINKKVNDVFEVQTPNGLKEYQINSINFI